MLSVRGLHSYDLSVANIVIDKVTGLHWERYQSETARTRPEAVAYCSLSNLGGYSDWRLPSLIELVSLLDLSYSSLNIDGTAFPPTTFDQSAGGWSSDVNPEGTLAGVVAGGLIYEDPPTQYKYRSRCVRKHATPRCYAKRYQVRSGNTVYDAATGLTWQQKAKAQLTFDEATAFCASLPGFSRLPSLKELATLGGGFGGGPTLDPTAFPGEPRSRHWSSTLDAKNSTNAWEMMVFSPTPFSNSSATSTRLNVRCVE
jgi:hypothetical protein